MLWHFLWTFFNLFNCFWSFLQFFLAIYNCCSRPETESNKWSFSIKISIILSLALNNSSSKSKQTKKITNQIHKSDTLTILDVTYQHHLLTNHTSPKHEQVFHLLQFLSCPILCTCGTICQIPPKERAGTSYNYDGNLNNNKQN